MYTCSNLIWSSPEDISENFSLITLVLGHWIVLMLSALWANNNCQKGGQHWSTKKILEKQKVSFLIFKIWFFYYLMLNFNVTYDYPRDTYSNLFCKNFVKSKICKILMNLSWNRWVNIIIFPFLYNFFFNIFNFLDKNKQIYLKKLCVDKILSEMTVENVYSRALSNVCW